MIYGLLVTLFVLLCILLMALILIQKSKGSLGLGNIGGSMQMLFGGSGGQDFLQKITWILGGIFMLSCLGLSVYRSNMPRSSYSSKYTKTSSAQPVEEIPAPKEA
ncbi:MAG: Preprotein translocase, SecG subunit [candidate division TM6 bacterium GW2011_GWF2_43_17]|nr:MAG: Preprotein translocase, SecG subunit [candidate division TM6 bacterium GW2011_GWF2_43_17]